MDDGRVDDPAPDKTTWELSPDLEGRILGDFRIVRKLGEGGMGIVFEAEQQHPKRPVALKVIRGGAFVDENQIKMFQREALRIKQLALPSGDPDIVSSWEGIGYVLVQLGRYEEAERVLMAAVADIEKTYGTAHPTTANALESLTECQWKQGRLDEAMHTASRALAINEAATDPDNVGISQVLYVIAHVGRDLGRVTEAERDFRRCLTLREKVFGPASPEVAVTLDAYALLLRVSGRGADAAAIEARARAIPHSARSVAGFSYNPTH